MGTLGFTAINAKDRWVPLQAEEEVAIRDGNNAISDRGDDYYFFNSAGDSSFNITSGFTAINAAKDGCGVPQKVLAHITSQDRKKSIDEGQDDGYYFFNGSNFSSNKPIVSKSIIKKVEHLRNEQVYNVSKSGPPSPPATSHNTPTKTNPLPLLTPTPSPPPNHLVSPTSTASCFADDEASASTWTSEAEFDAEKCQHEDIFAEGRKKCVKDVKRSVEHMREFKKACDVFEVGWLRGGGVRRESLSSVSDSGVGEEGDE